jgi:hypothetical protein
MISDSDGIIFLNKNANTTTLDGKRGAYFGTHYFGDDVAQKYSKFMSYYVSYEKDKGAYATEKMVIAKKPIYNSVKDLDKYFKKEAKKNRIPTDEAKERFEKVLDTAIKVRFYRTYDFEALLKSAESEEEMEEIFNKVRIE